VSRFVDSDGIMRVRTLLIGAALAGSVALAACLGWRAYTTPAPPALPLGRMEKPVAAAVGDALQKVRRQPRSAAAWGDLGLVLSANRYESQAVPCFAQADALDPADPRWPYDRATLLLAHDHRAALPLLRRAAGLARTPEERAAVLTRLALTEIEDGQLEDADRDLRALGEVAPDDPRLHLGLGLVAVARDDGAAARLHLSALTDSPFARKRACSLLAGLAGGDRDSARRYQTLAAGLPPDLPWPDPFLAERTEYEVRRASRLGAAKALDDEGRHAEALAELRQLAEEDPHPEVYHALGLTLMNLQQLGEAETMLRLAVRLGPDRADAQALLGSVLLLRAERRAREPGGQAEAAELAREALAAEDRAVALNPKHAPAHLTRARALKFLWRTDEALRAARAALLCGPEFPDVHLCLGEMLAESGQVREGLGHLEDAARLAPPNDPRPREALAKWRARTLPPSP
jgi:tetratricopeptide (TPR) repeat protein